MKKNKEHRFDFEIIKKCPFLYCGVNKTLQESLIPFGFECREGWKEPLLKLSAALETLNLTYWPKYHIRIQADQVKEKFGILHFYYSIIRDGIWYKRIPYNFFLKLNHKLKTINYAYKQVQDKAPYIEHIKVELTTKEEFVKEQYYAKNITNVKVWEEDGKFWKQTDYLHYGTWNNVPTKHKLLHKFISLSWKFICIFDSHFDSCSDEQAVIMKFMDSEAERLIKLAEDECYDTCEECGANIGKNGFSKRCKTSGWITYICDKCAKTHKNNYFMNGALYNKGKCIKTKEEIDAEQAEIEAKYKANRKKYDEERFAFEKELVDAREEDIKAGRIIVNESKK